VTVLRRPGHRFVIEAVAIVLVAAFAGLAHLDWWEIALCVLAVAFVVESRLAHATATKPERERVAQPAAEPEPPPALEAEPELVPEPEPVPVAVSTLVPDGPWNVWELERTLRERGDTDEERAFLLHYLRDYAVPDGVLPAEFDDLVRESFGMLLAS